MKLPLNGSKSGIEVYGILVKFETTSCKFVGPPCNLVFRQYRFVFPLLEFRLEPCFWPPASQGVPSHRTTEAEVLLQRALSGVITPEFGRARTSHDHTNGYPGLDGVLSNPSQV
jgi:hypothetical protein